MLTERLSIGMILLACVCEVGAECGPSKPSKGVDPVAVGFCESDAVFVGKVEQRIETSRAYTEPGTDKTLHLATQRSTVTVQERFKGDSVDRVTMISELYDKQRAFEFESGKTYLIFAKKIKGDEFAGASERCSVQPTLPIEDAKKARKRLQDHSSGKKPIECAAQARND